MNLAVYGLVRTVVWEGEGREAFLYPDYRWWAYKVDSLKFITERGYFYEYGSPNSLE
jgi:hypothetical protein